MKHNLSALLFDLDGTVYRGTDPIPGADRFFERLKKASVPFLFVTNRSNRTPLEVAEQLNAMGIVCDEDDVFTSSQAVAYHLGAVRAYCLGEEGLFQALKAAGAEVVDDKPDVVIVGYDRSITYDRLSQAMRHIMAGARFIATNTDRIILVEDGFLPEAGPLVAALENATDQKADIIGKPSRVIMDAALEKLGVGRESCAIVGDYLLTDIQAAQNADMRSVLILTGVSQRSDLETSTIQPTWTVEDYDALEALLFA
ncbi:HAD-IIA family hydrolase [Coralliovum pocilloporae]|uniref:HAD-IIA family hydrolase n=1 Tax=Coralliovum pocilloporae TaxID=3066369 RepID=UPI0033077108